MTKMPEPFGYVVDHICDDIRFSKEKPSQPKDALAEVEVEITPVITTSQAEEYKDECVREALEKAARLIDPYNEEGTLGALNAKLILSLTYKE